MFVKQVVNSIHKSNTFILFNEESGNEDVYLIDIGDFDIILSILHSKIKVKGLFITHSHFDHIYGINKLNEKFPDVIIYTSDKGKEGLFSDKLNFSLYHENSIVFSGTNIKILKEGDTISLFNNYILEVFDTSGHDWSCLSYKVSNYLFTGDSYIPGLNVVTTFPRSDKKQAAISLEKILGLINDKTIICPGHGEMTGNLNKTNIVK